MISREKIKAVVFDCDGVMFDTSDANRAYYNELLGMFSKPALTDGQFKKVHMYTVRQAIDYLLPDISRETVFKTLKEIGYHRFIQHMKMEPGLVRLLAALKANGYIRGIGTNRTDTMEKVLKVFDLDSCFEVVVTAADVKNPKPDPEQLMMIMNRYGLSPDHILFIGDSVYDEQAANGAGTWFCAYRNPELIAHLHAGSMDDIAEFLGIK